MSNRRSYDLLNVNLNTNNNYPSGGTFVIWDDLKEAMLADTKDSEDYNKIGTLHAKFNRCAGLAPPKGSDILSPPSPIYTSPYCYQD